MQLREDVNGSHFTNFTYDRDNRVTEIGFGGSDGVKYVYDNLGRVTSKAVEGGNSAGNLTSTYSYVAGGYGTNSTTPLVAKITQPQIPFEYTYDTRGNIISEKRGTLTTTYAYDALGQLIRVNDPHENATWVYNYDRGGNMTSKVKYAYTTGTLGAATSTVAYAYNGNWKDQLVSNGSYALTYDAIGNLKTYAGWVYEWEAGRQLKKQTQNEKVVVYDYDHNGMRIRQTVSNKSSGYVYATYNYTYNGNKLVHMTVYSDDLHFFYDNQGRAAKVRYNGVMYSYLHNLQGDIVGIVDGSGALVVEYKYNAWGTILSRTGSMANTLGHRNPFRYRGYIYDEETWMYWLKNRYFYPELHRFINADLYIGLNTVIFSHNTVSYCINDPVNYIDYSGYDTMRLSIADGRCDTSSFISSFIGLGLVTVGYEIIVSTAPTYTYSTSFAKGHQGNMRDTSLRDKSDDEIQAELDNPSTSAKRKQQLRKEQKARGTRNVNKRKEYHHKSSLTLIMESKLPIEHVYD